MKRNRILTIVAVVLIVGVAVWLLWGSGPKQKIMFETTKVAKGSISNSVTATGTIEPVTLVEVGTQVSGIVSNIYADFNSVVKKGEIIAELDKINLLNDLASKKSTEESAKTEYEYQLKNYTRIKTLHEKQLVSDSDYDTALYSYEKARNSYNISKNDVAKAETNLGYATIISPIDGVVLSRDVEEGQTVAASFSTPTLFTIANDLTDMQVVADVDEADIGDIREGQRVTFKVDAYPTAEFEGRVTQVRQQATETSNVITYEVVISAPNPDLKLKPGLTATVTIYTLEKNDILAVPAKALRFVPEPPLVGPKDTVIDVDARHRLWTREGNTFTAHPVEIGISNGVLTEIISGINEGTIVVSNATMGAASGQAMSNGQSGQQESSPFMPTRPGNRNNTNRR